MPVLTNRPISYLIRCDECRREALLYHLQLFIRREVFLTGPSPHTHAPRYVVTYACPQVRGHVYNMSFTFL